MKVGILVECGPQGLEAVVCRRLCELLRASTGIDFQFDIVPMDNKARLITDCGTAAARLFDDGCDRVVVLWDERPAWPNTGERLCWHNDRRDALRSIQQAGVGHRSVHLVCIEREFESWLLFDHGMLSKVLSTDAHPVRIRRQRDPDRMQNPKSVMTRLFKQHRGLKYVDVEWARRFAQSLQDLTQLRRCSIFRRFAERVTGKPV